MIELYNTVELKCNPCFGKYNDYKINFVLCKVLRKINILLKMFIYK